MGIVVSNRYDIKDRLSLALFIELLNGSYIKSDKEKRVGIDIYIALSKLNNKNIMDLVDNTINNIRHNLTNIEDIEEIKRNVYLTHIENTVEELMIKLSNTQYATKVIEGWTNSYCSRNGINRNYKSFYINEFRNYFIYKSSTRLTSDIFSRINYTIMISALRKKLNKITYDANRSIATQGASNESSIEREEENDFILTNLEVHNLLAWSKILNKSKGESLTKFISDLLFINLESGILRNPDIKIIKFYSYLGGSYISYIKSYKDCIESYNQYMTNPNFTREELDKIIIKELSIKKFPGSSKPNCRTDIGGDKIIWDKRLQLIKGVLPVFNKIINASIENNKLMIPDEKELSNKVKSSPKLINISKMIESKNDDIIQEITESISNEKEIKFDMLIEDMSVLPFMVNKEQSHEKELELELNQKDANIITRYKNLYLKADVKKSLVKRIETGNGDSLKIKLIYDNRNIKEISEYRTIQRLKFIESGIPMAKTITKEKRLGLPKSSIDEVMFCYDIPTIVDLNKDELVNCSLYEKYISLTSLLFVRNENIYLIGSANEGSLVSLKNENVREFAMSNNAVLGFDYRPLNVSNLRLDSLGKFIKTLERDLKTINTFYKNVGCKLPSVKSIGSFNLDNIFNCKNLDYTVRMMYDYARYLDSKNMMSFGYKNGITYIFDSIKYLYSKDTNHEGSLDLQEYYELFCEYSINSDLEVLDVDSLLKSNLKSKIRDYVQNSDMFQILYGDSMYSLVYNKILSINVAKEILAKLKKPLDIINKCYHRFSNNIDIGLSYNYNLGLTNGYNEYRNYELWSEIEDNLAYFEKLPQTINSAMELSKLLNIRINSLYKTDSDYDVETYVSKIMNDIGLDSIRIIDDFVMNNTETVRIQNTHFILVEQDILPVPINKEVINITEEQEDLIFDKFLYKKSNGRMVNLLLIQDSLYMKKLIEENKSPILKMALTRIKTIFNMCIELGYDIENKDCILTEDIIKAYVIGSRNATPKPSQDLDRICKVIYDKIYRVIKIANNSLENVANYCRFKSTKVQSVNHTSIEDNLHIFMLDKTITTDSSNKESRNIFLEYFKRNQNKVTLGDNNLLYNKDKTIFTVKIDGEVYGVCRIGYYIPEKSEGLYPIPLNSYPIDKARNNYLG